MEKKYSPVQFVVCDANKKLVTANKYVPHALYTQNKAIVESLGGEILKGGTGFIAQFKKQADAKKFVAQAITEMSNKDYEASRQKPVESKKTKPKQKGKAGKKASAPTGKQAETEIKPKRAHKSKKDAAVAITSEQKKVINKLNASLWNRAAAAYDRANGGTGTVTFDTLGKTKEELKDYIPAGIANLKKSKLWQKAVDANIAEDMLG